MIEWLKNHSPANFLQWLDDIILPPIDRAVDSFLCFSQTVCQNWLWAWKKHPEWWAVANVVLVWCGVRLIVDFVKWTRRKK